MAPELLDYTDADADALWDDLDLLPPSYFSVHGEQLVWDGEGETPVDWKTLVPHIDDAFVNRGDRLRGLLSWFLNRVTVEHANTGRGWEPVRALLFFVRAYPFMYSPSQLAAIAVGYERRLPVLRRERRLAAPSRVTPPRERQGRKRRRRRG